MLSKAHGLMLLSAFFASIGSLDINNLTRREGHYHWTQVLFSNGAIGCAMCVLNHACRKCRRRQHKAGQPPEVKPLFGRVENVHWLLARGILGGIAMAFAFTSLSLLDMAQANVLMFTNPVWTGIFSWMVLRQAWSWYDLVLCIVAFLGTLLVMYPHSLGKATPDHTPRPPPFSPWLHWLGVGSGLAFAVFIALASLIINSKLKGKEEPNTVSLYLFLGVLLIDLPFLFLHFDPSTIINLDFHLFDTYMFLGVGVLFYSFQYLRSWALLTSCNASVVNMLYAEVAFSFLWGTALLHQPFFWSSCVGASLIIGACLLVSWLKKNSSRREQNSSSILLSAQEEAFASGANSSETMTCSLSATAPPSAGHSSEAATSSFSA